ncbi:MAG: 3'-5' exonuclease [Clostridia bacterium]|nr:3'-5' exonuclease [Clostridia bacterium]
MIIYFDTETSGLRPGQICQLSYVMQSGDQLSARNFFFTVDQVEYSAFLVHGFSVEKLRVFSGGKRFKDYAEQIEKDFLSADLVVAHNISFDAMFMSAEFERINKQFCVKDKFCSMKNSTPLCKLPRSSGQGYKYPKLSELCAFFDIDDIEIQNATERIFGSKTGFHDARFDTTALLLAVNKGMSDRKVYQEILNCL